MKWLRKLFPFNINPNVMLIEKAAARLAYWWSIVLLLPVNIFKEFHVYGVMTPEIVWGINILLIGITHTVGLKKENYLLRRIGLLLSTGFWLFTGTSLLLGGLPLLLIVAYFLFAWLTASVYVKVGEQKHGR